MIRDVMQKEFLAVPPELRVLACVQEMVRRREGFALVVEAGRAVGIVTEWDLIEKVLAAHRDPESVRVAEVASHPIKTVRVDTPTMDVVEEFARSGIRRALVMEGDRPVGVVTGRDLFRAFRTYVDQVSADVAGLHSTMG